jgi:uncharacterized protein YecE (DUF72 family)
VAARIIAGTASWTDPVLVKTGWYPKGVSTPEARLRYYASQFPLVEADTTYYGLPVPEIARAWVARTPPGFTFDVKAYSLFTEHPTVVERLPGEIQRALPPDQAKKRTIYRKDTPGEVVDLCWSTFVDGLLPLHEGGRLGVVVFQFPKWVFPNRRTLKYFEEIRQRLGPYRAAFEFRNDTWMKPEQREETLAVLGDLGFAYVCVDEPQGFQSSVPPVAAATTDLGFVRFHGRNRETWEKRTRTSAERFDYFYPAAELDEWVPKIAELARGTRETHLVMNTNNYDQGPVNTRLLEERLEAAGVAMAHWAPAMQPLPGMEPGPKR